MSWRGRGRASGRSGARAVGRRIIAVMMDWDLRWCWRVLVWLAGMFAALCAVELFHREWFWAALMLIMGGANVYHFFSIRAQQKTRDMLQECNAALPGSREWVRRIEDE